MGLTTRVNKGKGKYEPVMYEIKGGKMKKLLSTILMVVLLTGNISISAFAAQPIPADTVSEELSENESGADGIDGSYDGTSATEEGSAEETSDAGIDQGSTEEWEEESAEDGEQEEASDNVTDEEQAEDMSSEEALTESEAGDSAASEEAGSEAVNSVLPEGFEGMVDEGPVCAEYDGYADDDPELLGAAGEVLVDITGTYYTVSASTVLDRLNRIRKEAYDLGYVDRYVPLKWSSAIEASARIRAMEAGITVDHTTLGRHDPLSYLFASGQFWSANENLAWNNDHNANGIMVGINQFYEEKSDYAARRKDGKVHGITGHYENIIDPDMTHVGIAGCQMNCTPHGWFTVAMQMGSAGDEYVDETKDNSSGRTTQTLRASAGNIGSLSISGPTVISAGGEARYQLGGKLKVRTYDGNVCPEFAIPGDDDRGVVWVSSDPDIATVENGLVRAVSGGDVTLTATIGSLKAEKKVAVAKPTTGFTIRSGADGPDVTGKVIEASVGDVLSYICVIEPDDAYDKTVKWSSSNTAIATVSSTGISSATIRCTGCGEAEITCINENAEEPIIRSFTVRGSISASAVSLNTDKITLYEGERYRLTARILPEGTEGSITFASDRPEVAKVSADGEVTAVSPGEAGIIVSSGSLKEAVCSVTVLGLSEAEADTPCSGEDSDCVWVASESIIMNNTYTGKAVTQPGIRVYCGSHRLEEGRDYTLSYRNNIKAADAGDRNAPQVTVILKGHYQGRKTYCYNILPVDIGDVCITEKQPFVVTATGKDVKPVPELWIGSKKLANKTDFNCEYPDEEYRSTEGEHTIKVHGHGNFTGDRVVRFRIADKKHDLSKASVTAAPSDPTAKKIYYKGEVTADDISLTVKFGSEILPASYYSITDLPKQVGKGSIRIEATPEGNAASYYGSKTVKVTTYADRSIKDAVFEGFCDSMEYDRVLIDRQGSMIQSAYLKYGDEILTEGTDYRVTYSSNKKVGRARVTYTGLGRYSGKIVKSYKITPYSGAIDVVPQRDMVFVKGGVKPVVTVTDNGRSVLKEKTDYTVSIRNKSNLKPGVMSFKIVGKGNYKGYASDYYDVNISNGDLSGASLAVSDRKYVSKGTGWKSSVKITDSNGKTLTAGRDYEKNVLYSYPGMADKKVPAAGTAVYVTAVGKGYYEGSSITRSYRIVEKDISSLVFVADDMTYSGSSIEPAAGRDIHAYASKKDAKAGMNELKNIYEIVGSSSNIASGTGRITVRGTGRYGGTRVLKFRILKQTYRMGKSS